MSTHHPDAPTRAGLSRRSVLRAGAHAAWTVPVVSVVTASPAFAAASGPATLNLAFALDSAGTGGTWNGSLVVTADGAGGPVTSTITVDVSVAKGTGRLDRAPRLENVVGSGWVGSERQPQGSDVNPFQYRFAYACTPDAPLRAGASATVSFQLRRSGQASTGQSVRVNCYAQAFAPGTTSSAIQSDSIA